jgi:hypothetical protein
MLLHLSGLGVKQDMVLFAFLESRFGLMTPRRLGFELGSQSIKTSNFLG